MNCPRTADRPGPRCRSPRPWGCALLPGWGAWVALLLAGTLAVSAQNEVTNILDLTIEQLQQIPITGASRYEQSQLTAPASVTVVGKDDIKHYGYRTLADVLRSVRGFNVTYDRNYQYLGVRGFGRPGDYNSRVLIMVDGHRINDNVQDSGFIGTEFPLDVDLIERVEVIRGPSSSVYGNNAFFAVINVITRRGASVGGVEISGEAASFDGYRGRFTYGAKLAGDVELLLSGSFFDRRGHDRLNYPEYSTINNGNADGLDGERAQGGFLSLRWHSLTLQGAYQSREKSLPTASYTTVFNDPRTRTTDRVGYVDLKLDHEFENATRLLARAYYDRYENDGDYLSDYGTPGTPQLVLNRDVTRGDRVGAEIGFSRKFLDRHTLSGGVEFRESLRKSQLNFDESPYDSILSTNTPSRDAGVYLQAELELLPRLLLNAGGRFDYTENYGNNLSPRAALIWSPRAATTFKLLYGEAFRAPNGYEQYYNDGGFSQTNSPTLIPETIRTYELAVEQRLGEHYSLNASAFYYHINDLITQTFAGTNSNGDPVTNFRNISSVASRGLGLDLLGQWPGGLRGRASYSLTRAEDLTGGTELSNSPRHQGKLNLAVPLWQEKIFAGLELQYTTSRHNRPNAASGQVGDFWLANATLYSRELVKGMDLSASVYNLLDRRYADPASANFTQAAIQQDGRNFRVKLTWRF